MSGMPEVVAVRELTRAWDEMHLRYFPDHDTRWESVIAAVREQLAVPGRVVDLGCGPGSLTARLAGALPDREVVGVDLDDGLIALARAACWPGCDFEVGDENALRGRPAAAVVSSAMLHYQDRAGLLNSRRAVYDALLPGGVLVEVDRWAAPVSDPGGAWASWWERALADPYAGPLLAASSRVGESAGPGVRPEDVVEVYAEAGFGVVRRHRLPSGSELFLAKRRTSSP